MQDSALSEENKLLLDIHENIEEPDGIYAVARSAHPEMQSALFAHEGAAAHPRYCPLVALRYS